MTLDAMRRAVARLLTDNQYQERFFADDSHNHERYGLTRDEFRSLRKIDAKNLGIVSEGYVGKRFERVESAFPRTLRALEAFHPDARAVYLARTQFPSSDAGERDTFIQYLRGGFQATDPVRRFFLDLATVEHRLYDARPAGRLPSYRLRPDASRPKRGPDALTVRLQGPLERHWADPPTMPQSYEALAHEVFVVRDGDAIDLIGLEGPTAGLYAACDGSRTISELAKEFGPETATIIDRWLRLRMVEDAAPL